MGITDVWLPPAYKGAAGGYSVGYDTYDLFDLGEFDQKGTVATKYGDRGAFENACHTLGGHGIGAIHDVVFNHKLGADEKERVKVRRANSQDRTQIEDEAFEALAYTRFTFPGRQGNTPNLSGRRSAFPASTISRIRMTPASSALSMNMAMASGTTRSTANSAITTTSSVPMLSCATARFPRS
nr:alpha-amylase family glycosyl hydrolase [Marinicella sp. W31]MDC2875676.1 alpha-amylase family glycosyl hydrolase [Marinicella sp. W31]